MLFDFHLRVEHTDYLHLGLNLPAALHIIDKHFLQIQPFSQLCTDADPSIVVKFFVRHPNPPYDLDAVLEFVDSHKPLYNLLLGPSIDRVQLGDQVWVFFRAHPVIDNPGNYLLQNDFHFRRDVSSTLSIQMNLRAGASLDKNDSLKKVVNR